MPDHRIIGEKMSNKRSRAAYYAVYDLQGGPIPQALRDRLESAILEAITDYPTIAITVKTD